MTRAARNDGGPFEFVVGASSELASIAHPLVGQFALATDDGTIWYHTGSAWAAAVAAASEEAGATFLAVDKWGPS